MIHNRFVSFRRDVRGATSVEFGFVAVPMLMFIFGAIEFSRAYWTQSSLEQTAATVARCMGLELSNCAVNNVYNAALTQSYAQTVAGKWGLTLPASDLTLNSTASCGGVSGFSQVTINHTFNSMVPGVVTVLGHNFVLTASACFPNGGASGGV
ncbi:TadE/TadG family type IV pilus assembly protein [Methylocystis heyeri]|uniref:Pilus assembly protein n=1 Tax=Methylocystis heyeri TaxID=391905 RepID=A0A6B8KG10_9HYPH|nr:TadE/TadG family type IV pilus assembly protein [Methylocystis heyeri]QGM45941.1 pilus assembly protein [Methylocystis heyeri]